MPVPIPTVLNPGDPSAQDETSFQPGDHANYQAFGGGPLDVDAYAAAEQAFWSDYQAWLAGDAPYAALVAHRDRLGLDLRPHHDTRRLLTCDVALPDALLADVVEDELPDAALYAERITGDPFLRPAVGVMAALAWVGDLLVNRRVVDAWIEDEPDRALASAAHRVDRSPPCLYLDGVPQLPLAPKMTPPAGPPGVYVARAYRLGDGWAFSSKVDLPALPEPEAYLRRITVEGWRLRLRERRATWEDVLRQRSEVVYRAAFEGAVRRA